MMSMPAGNERATPLPFDLVREELRQVDELLLQETWSAVSIVRDISHHILGAGGKRLRPALLLTTARAAGYQGDWAIRLALCMELLHTATLMHDDVLDHSDWRRGRVTAHRRWGQSASILTGDAMFARAMRILVDYGSLPILNAVTSAVIRVCEGEVMEIALHGDLDIAPETYLRVIDAKTAALISVCCQTGGMLGQTTPAQVEALSTFGFHLGMAFQMVDDLLDFTAKRERWGRPAGEDLKEGRITLPVIYTLQRATPADRERLRTILNTPSAAVEHMDEVLSLLHRYGGFEAARADAIAHTRAARESLLALPASAARDALAALADFVVARDQ
ncbi:MAG TPA: polyprenyl synthetase family protein [Armatimonadota bacterium]|jgi:octaprenyl-diphosphate synthase|nr:polyprenyl synthetase family protein [Armatimonadota bacterium]